MRRFFVLSLLAIFLPITVNAHVLESESSMGVVLHIDPEDKPIARGENTFLLEFKDTENEFSLDNCECFLTISKDDKEIQKLPITPVSENEKLSAAIPYVFPEKGVYLVEVSGIPINGADFKEFDFDFDEEVLREAQSPSPQSTTIPDDTVARKENNSFAILAGVIIVLLALFIGLKAISKKKTE